MAMTTASATVTAQQIRDRLLQATDAHNNSSGFRGREREGQWFVKDGQISNMVAVLDVISTLEKYPITKEALEETRLGKLINDLRKKTRDEDLAKRAKKLLRNWQRLIDPQQPEVLPKELSSTLSSVVGSSWSETLPVSRAPQIATDKKPVSQSVHSSSTDKISCMKSQQKVEKTLLTLKATKRSALSTASRSSGGPEEAPPQSAIKPQINSELKEPTASTVFRKSILEHQGQRDVTAAEKVKHKAHSHYTNLSPRSLKQLSKQLTSFPVTESEPLSALSTITSIQGMHTECHEPKDLSHPDTDSLLNSDRMLEQTNNLQNKSKGLARLQPGLLSEVTNVETEKEIKHLDSKRRKPQLRDCTINMEGRSPDDTCKPVRVKNRKLTFNPLTQQIRLSAANQGEEPHNPAVDVNEPVNLKQSTSAPSPSALHQMNWKDMSQNEIVKYYLNLQNTLLKTSRNQVPRAHVFTTEYMKCEEDNMRDTNRTYVQVANVSETNLPGIDRDITTEDIYKINNKHWPGVNGCYDSKGHWYGWTECISLDTYGDGSKLNILPYVCID